MGIKCLNMPPEDVKRLFEEWNETLIWSCLQGTMGELYVDSSQTVNSAMAILGDFCFFAGKVSKELVLFKPESCKQDFIIMIPENEAWAEMIETCYGEKAKKIVRYAIKKEKDVFDKKMLQKAAEQLPQEYTMQKVTKELFRQCKNTPWCHDLVSQYPDYETYQKHGLGVVILKGNEIVSGASSYSDYLDGIEIEIDTREEYRRKAGLLF